MSVVKPLRLVSVVSLVAWLDGHEASPHDRAGEAELHGCVAEISCWHCTVTWPRSGACVARLLGRDPKVARAWVFECLCVLMYCSILTVLLSPSILSSDC